MKTRKPKTLPLNPEDVAEFFGCYDGGDKGLMLGERYVILQINESWDGWKNNSNNKFQDDKRQKFIKKLRKMAKWLNRAADWLEE